MRPSLLLIFTCVTALSVGALALFVGSETSASIRREASAGAERAAEVFTRLALESDEFEAGRLTAEATEDLHKALRATRTVFDARVWDNRGSVVFERDRRLARGPRRPPERLREALGGRVVSEQSSFAEAAIDPRRTGSRRDDEVLVVYVPVRIAPRRAPVGVLQAIMPYAEVRAEIARRTRRLHLTLAGAALLFYLALIPTIARGSRELGRAYRRSHVALQRELRRAIEREELVLRYQPKLDLRTGEVRAVEALLRWNHPSRGMVPPLEFLPRAEQTPVMEDITLHVVRLALRDMVAWRAQGLELNVAVNLSPANLRDAGLPWKLAELLAEREVSARTLTIEITESAVMTDADGGEKVLGALRRMGFRISIDDFGTGQSSLGRLGELPLDELKIDRTFVMRMGDDGERTLIAAVVGLAHELDLRVVAEGVESDHVARILGELGCDEIQGFYLSKPIPSRELVEWVERRRGEDGGELHSARDHASGAGLPVRAVQNQ